MANEESSGEVIVPTKSRWTPAIVRFLDKIEGDPDACWTWAGAKNWRGYGKFHDKTAWQAHRWSYTRWRGPIPDGLQIDHLCRNRACVNPWHLEPVTQRENLMRGIGPSAKNARKTHCANGHPYDDGNTGRASRRGGRRCLTCHRDRERARRGG